MKIFHASDLHYCPEHLEEVDRCFAFAIENSADCDVAVISGDLWDHRVELHTPAVSALLGRIRDLADRMPVLILQGTLSHDTPGALDVFRMIGGDYQIYVADTPGQIMLGEEDVGNGPWHQVNWDDFPMNGDTCLFSVLPALSKSAIASIVGPEAAAESAGAHILGILRGWAERNDDARAAGIPTVLVSHGTVSGSETEHGVPMAGLDHEFTVGALWAANTDAVMLGHIHKHQKWTNGGQCAAYPGSIGRLHYGECGDKGFLIWDVQPGRATCRLVPTPAKTLLDVQFSGAPDMARLAELAEEAAAMNAHVRIRYAVDEEHRHSVDRAAITALFAGAGAVKLEGTIHPVQRQRSPGISHVRTLGEQLQRWCEVTQTKAGPLLERLRTLEIV